MKFKLYRKKRGWTQHDVAKLLGISQASAYRLEKEDRSNPPKKAIILKIKELTRNKITEKDWY